MSSKGLIFVVSGPSGSGKTTILKKVLAARQFKNRLVKPVSFTTRPKRSGEKNKRDYFFISRLAFQGKFKAKKILERTRYLGYDYGTPRAAVEQALKRGRHIILCLDFKGVVAVKRFYPQQTVTIFIKAPSLKALAGRIGKRCSRTHLSEIRRRLRLAKKELLLARQYDYCLVNRELAQAVGGLKEIIRRRLYGLRSH